MQFLLLDAGLAAIPFLLFLVLRSAASRRRGGGSASLTIRAFLAGLFSVIPAAVLELYLLPPPGPETSVAAHGLLLTACRAFLAVAFVEEGAKFLALAVVSVRPKHGSAGDSRPGSAAGHGEPDLILAGIATGLGFALLENAFYHFDGTGTLLLRGLLAVPLHACAGGFLGMSARSGAAGTRFRPAGFLAAFLVHGLYDTLIGLELPVALFAPVTVAAAAALVRRSYVRAVCREPRGDSAGGPDVKPFEFRR